MPSKSLFSFCAVKLWGIPTTMEDVARENIEVSTSVMAFYNNLKRESDKILFKEVGLLVELLVYSFKFPIGFLKLSQQGKVSRSRIFQYFPVIKPFSRPTPLFFKWNSPD